jgi:hypothetical protein
LSRLAEAIATHMVETGKQKKHQNQSVTPTGTRITVAQVSFTGGLNPPMRTAIRTKPKAVQPLIAKTFGANRSYRETSDFDSFIS